MSCNVWLEEKNRSAFKPLLCLSVTVIFFTESACEPKTLLIGSRVSSLDSSVEAKDVSIAVDVEESGIDSGDIDSQSMQNADVGTDASTTTMGSVSQLALGAHHTCALKKNGAVYCWGDNSYGQLGLGNTISPLLSPAPVLSFAQGSGVVQIAAGSYHTCARKQNGEVYCWGDNSLSQLGDGTQVQQNVPMLVPVSGAGITSLLASGNQTCSVGAGSLYCWGDTAWNRTQSLTITSPNMLGVGQKHLCALTSSGGVLCWGTGEHGSLGMGDLNYQYVYVPTSVSRLVAGSNIVKLASGGFQTYALQANGTVYAWGENAQGALGVGNLNPQAVPVQVFGLGVGSQVSSLVTNGNQTYALKSDGSVWCWGSNNSGALGIGNNFPDQIRPFLHPYLGVSLSVSELAAAGEHGCALLQDARVFCWGDNSYGELGVGNTQNQTTPTFVTQL